MEPIQIVGMDEADDKEKDLINKIANEYHQKIQRSLRNVAPITLHLKTHTNGGKAKKWDLRVKVAAPTSIFEAQESDWDLPKSLHKVFNNIERQLQHKLHTDSQKPDN